MRKITKVVVLPDIHAPKHHQESLEVVLEFIKDYKPNMLIQLGDLCDFDSLSKYDTLKEKDLISLTREVEGANDVLDQIEKVLPWNCDKVLLEGNHDRRPETYRINRWDAQAKRLFGLSQLPDFHVLYNLKKRGWEWVEENKLYDVGRASFVHGFFTNQYHAAKTVRRWFKTIIYGHCFDTKTQLLTKLGWKFEDEISSNDFVATMNKETKLLEWNKVNEKFEYYDYEKAISIKSRGCDLLVTEDHGLVDASFDRKSVNLFKAKDFNDKATRSFYRCLNSNNPGLNLTDNELKLLVWIAADGSLENTTLVRFHFRKERKIKRLTELLDAMGIIYSLNRQTLGTIKINFNWSDVKTSIPISMLKPFQVDPLLVNKRQADIILEEYSHTDGCKLKKGCYQISTSKFSEVELLQQIFVTNGIQCNKTIRPLGYILSVNTNRNYIEVRNKNYSEVNFQGKMWCVNVDNGTLLVRRNGKVCITQNTHTFQVHTIAGMDQKPVAGMSIGTLSRFDLSYLKGIPPDWCHMFMYMEFFGDGFFTPHCVPIINGKFCASKVYGN